MFAGEGWAIALQNLSGYYMIAVATTILAFFLSFYYTAQAKKRIEEDNNVDDSDDIDFADEADYVQDSEGNSRIKVTQAIANKLSSNMTSEQLQKEKEIERIQLEAIYNLLQEQQEKFQLSNMDELQEQLKLYR